MLTKALTKMAIARIQNHESIAKQKAKKQTAKSRHKEQMIKLFGKQRYYLAKWFGEWILYTNNHRLYLGAEEKLYQKFYTTEEVTQRYALRLQDRYENVFINEVYDKKKQHLGYMLNAYGKKEVQAPQNVVSFQKYKAKRS